MVLTLLVLHHWLALHLLHGYVLLLLRAVVVAFWVFHGRAHGLGGAEGLLGVLAGGGGGGAGLHWGDGGCLVDAVCRRKRGLAGGLADGGWMGEVWEGIRF